MVLNVYFLKTGVGISQYLKDSEGGKSQCAVQVLWTLFAIYDIFTHIFLYPSASIPVLATFPLYNINVIAVDCKNVQVNAAEYYLFWKWSWCYIDSHWFKIIQINSYRGISAMSRGFCLYPVDCFHVFDSRVTEGWVCTVEWKL